MRSASEAGTLREDYLSALLAGDGINARYVVDSALEAGFDAETLCLDVLQPALYDVGELWASGTIGIAHEHYATAVTSGVLGSLGPRIRRPAVGGRLAVVACSPGEQHAIGAEMVTVVLEGAGWEVLNLGAALPADALVRLVADEQPDVVGLSTSTAAVLPGALRAAERLGAMSPRPFVVVGGQAWDDVTERRLAQAGVDARLAGPRELVALADVRFPPVPEEDLL